MEKTAVRLRRATIEDYDFWKGIFEDIDNEILYRNEKAFSPEEITDEYLQVKKELDTERKEIIEFTLPETTEAIFESMINECRDKIYIIEVYNVSNNNKVKPVGYFQLDYVNKQEKNRICSWAMLPKYFKRKREAFELLLAQKELKGKEISIIARNCDCIKYWVVQFGFHEKDDDIIGRMFLG